MRLDHSASIQIVQMDSFLALSAALSTTWRYKVVHRSDIGPRTT